VAHLGKFSLVQDVSMPLPTRLETLEHNLDTAYWQYEQYRGDLNTTYDHEKKAAIKLSMAEKSKQIAEMERDWVALTSGNTVALDISDQEAEPLVGEWLHSTDQAIQHYEGNAQVLEKLNKIHAELQAGKAASAKLKVLLPIVPSLIHYELELDTESTLLQLWRKTRALFKPRGTQANP
jgi:hypothetical protein